MTLRDIVDVLQQITGTQIEIDSRILQKNANELSLSEANIFTKATGVSLDFLISNKINCTTDQQIKDYFEYKSWQENLALQREEIIRNIKQEYKKEITDFDFLLADGTIDGNKLLAHDDYDLYTIVSRNYTLNTEKDHGWASTFSRNPYQNWGQLESKIYGLLGNKLTDYRFAVYCISDSTIATTTLNRLDVVDFDSSVDKLKAIILLIKAGGILHRNCECQISSHFLTALLKDYCERKLIEKQGAINLD